MAKKQVVDHIQLQRLQVEQIPVDELQPNSYNPNRQNEKDFTLLKLSMQQDGFTQPIIALKDGKVIVDGEHRWRAARALGYKTVPVVLVDMTLEQMRLSTLRHNRARGNEDHQLTQALLRDLRELGALDVAVAALDIDERELERLLESPTIVEHMGGDTFGEAWVPMERDDSPTGEIKENRLVGISPAAKQQAQEIQAKMASLGDDQMAKKQLQKDMSHSTYRVNVVYSGEEAALVKGVLGTENTSARLYAIATKYNELNKVVVHE